MVTGDGPVHMIRDIADLLCSKVEDRSGRAVPRRIQPTLAA
jgi:hypothetical protein